MLEFQLTTSQGGRQIFSSFEHPIKIYFNSRPHKEVDKKERMITDEVEDFNSRPHKEVDYTDYRIYYYSKTFQLTTSQGGRPVQVSVLVTVFVFQLTTSQGGRRVTNCVSVFDSIYFNSRPHKEVDRIHKFSCYKIDISTHDLTRRSTLLQVTPQIYHSHFNSRPHKEVDAPYR